jgi:hypothetical protein
MSPGFLGSWPPYCVLVAARAALDSIGANGPAYSYADPEDALPVAVASGVVVRSASSMARDADDSCAIRVVYLRFAFAPRDRADGCMDRCDCRALSHSRAAQRCRVATPRVALGFARLTKICARMKKIVLHNSWESVQIQGMSTAQRTYDRRSLARQRFEKIATRDDDATTARSDEVRFLFSVRSACGRRAAG